MARGMTGCSRRDVLAAMVAMGATAAAVPVRAETAAETATAPRCTPISPSAA